MVDIIMSFMVGVFCCLLMRVFDWILFFFNGIMRIGLMVDGIWMWVLVVVWLDF